MSRRERSTPYALLGLLNLAPMSGYDMRQEIATSIGYFWSESFGQIYPALRDLAAAGLIRARPQTESRERRVYEITAKGRAAMRAWRAEPPRPAPVRNELLLKLFFGSTPGTMDEISWLEEHQDTVAARLREFRKIRRQLLSEQANHRSLPYWLAVLRHGEIMSEAALRWCEETSATLQKLQPKPRKRGGPK